jgi:hypothetical protein
LSSQISSWRGEGNLLPEPKGEPDFEREKWEADIRLREREIAIKDREAEAKIVELRRSRWANPLVFAVCAAAIAAGGNAIVALINGIQQRALEERHAVAENLLQTSKADAERKLEEGKAESARILEVIKTNDPDAAATNLSFLLDAGLIVGADRSKKLRVFLDNREPGKGPALAGNIQAGFFGFPEDYTCHLKDGVGIAAARDEILADLKLMQTSPLHVTVTEDRITLGGPMGSDPLFIEISGSTYGPEVSLKIRRPANPRKEVSLAISIVQGAMRKVVVSPICLETPLSTFRP